jgi:serine protease
MKILSNRAYILWILNGSGSYIMKRLVYFVFSFAVLVILNLAATNPARGYTSNLPGSSASEFSIQTANQTGMGTPGWPGMDKPTPLHDPGQPSAIVAAPTASLDMAYVSASDVNCFFDSDCTLAVSDHVSTFTLENASGYGSLQARVYPTGKAATLAAGLRGYEYRLDLGEMVRVFGIPCIKTLTLNFGPIVPLDYDDDGTQEYVYVVNSGGAGSIAPSSVDLLANDLTFTFTPYVCSGGAAGEGDSTFSFGLASPFNPADVTTAEIKDNLEIDYDIETKAPAYSSEIGLDVLPSHGQAGVEVKLVGTGFDPGGYTGSVLWDGGAEDTFDIPEGGAFSIPFEIPDLNPAGVYTITICAGSPCYTGDTEQKTKAPFEVDEPDPVSYDLFLPIVMGPENGGGTPEPFSYRVDPAVEPFQDELPGINGGDPRPLAAVMDPKGNVTTFVENEIMLQTDDASVLTDVLSETGGEVIYEIDPEDYGFSDLPKIHLIQFDPSSADTGEFEKDIESLMDDNIQSAGLYTYSSENGVGSFATAADWATDGFTVTVNWVGESDVIPVDSNEAPNGTTIGGIVYDSDAYEWAHFALGTTQDIGVPEAWNLLHNTGKDTTEIDIAILDGGFSPNADIPADTTYLNIFPFDPRGVAGIDPSCPWHGTDVLQTSMAVSDDDYGVVGVAAPVGDPIAFYTTYDFILSIGSVLGASAAGAEIINMSYGADVPSIFGWTVVPFESATAMVSSSGVLLFASAGNDGNNVDGKDCFLDICWEHTWVTPCENAGVICVGGLGWGSQFRAGGSNYGPDHVDIYAPYTVYGGWAPDNTGGDTMVTGISGTSFSSPYAASVAALVWAGDTTLSASQVWGIMQDTAHESPDFLVNGYVNAYDAVLHAINVGATVEITYPSDNQVHQFKRPIRFEAEVGFVSANDNQFVTTQWESNVDGILETQTFSVDAGSHTAFSSFWTSDLSEGDHTIYVTVTVGDVIASDSVMITNENSPPTASIDQPSDNAWFCANQNVNFYGSSSDPNEYTGLPDSAYGWSSNVDGILGTGASISHSFSTLGLRAITLTVTDDGGLSGTDSINIEIKSLADPDCSNLPPSATITTPDNGDTFWVTNIDATGWYVDVDFTGIVDDFEDPVSALTVSWSTDHTWTILSESVNPSTGVATMTARMYLDFPPTAHEVSLIVEDTDGNFNPTESIIVYINREV